MIIRFVVDKRHTLHKFTTNWIDTDLAMNWFDWAVRVLFIVYRLQLCVWLNHLCYEVV